MHAKIVIGSGYGDEGKGLTTDWLCQQELDAGRRPIVVRANGGCQAAHTVVTPQGQEHVFKHHGSGGFLGVPTYLGPRFLVNPIGFRQEREQMPAEARGKVYYSSAAQFTLPVDMMLNQLREEMRGDGKHGSCGWGIGECVERSTVLGLPVVAETVRGVLGIPEISTISEAMVRHRLGENLSEAGVSQEWITRMADANIIANWLKDCEYFMQNAQQMPAYDLPQVADTLVFEGAQGLGLDQNHHHFPHVTRSNTGSVNPLEIMSLVQQGGEKFASVEAVYVTRAYATRHGAGPLEHEGEPHGCTVVDPTNVPNQWQDNLRTAPLHVELTGQRIGDDLVRVLKRYPQATYAIMMTCLDQAGPDYTYLSAMGPHPEELEGDPSFVQGRIAGHAKLVTFMQGHESEWVRFMRSHGRTRADVDADAPERMPTVQETVDRLVAEFTP